jgi:hypothetical protein
MVRKFLQNYTSSVVGVAAGTYRPCPTALRTPVRGTVAPATAVGHDGWGPVNFQKFVIFLFELGWR